MAFGGNTPCIEVRVAERLFLIDAGSGIVPLGRELRDKRVRQIDILLSHVHLDHVSGLGFFAPLLDPETVIRLHIGNIAVEDAREALHGVFGLPIFVRALDDLPATIEYVGFQPGDTLDFGDTAVRTCPLDHPGGAVGYRFDHAGSSFCYLSDMEHRAGGHPDQLVRFAGEADLVLYDAMYESAQYERSVGWGHSTWAKGVELCGLAGARALAAFHHHPEHNDITMERIERELADALPGSFCARQYDQVVIGDNRREHMALHGLPAGFNLGD
jgi:phosphoribosyl 1,2-cyclic phosphodiesterase